MPLIEWRRTAYIPEMVRKYRRLVSKDARRHVYPNRRSPYAPLTLRVRTIWK